MKIAQIPVCFRAENVLLKNTFRLRFSDTCSTMTTSNKKSQSRNIVGTRVKEARKAHIPSLTQDQLSGQLAKKGVQLDRVAIAKIELGTRCVFDFEVKAIAAVLKVETNWLLGIVGRVQAIRRSR
jgi:hypothetical protein